MINDRLLLIINCAVSWIKYYILNIKKKIESIVKT